MRPPVSAGGALIVQFADFQDYLKVDELMDLGWDFQRAVDFLELRPFTHYSMTRDDSGLEE